MRQVPGIVALSCSPSRDLTLSKTALGKTQYQYSLDAPDEGAAGWSGLPEANWWGGQNEEPPELRDVASDQQNNGLGLLSNT